MRICHCVIQIVLPLSRFAAVATGTAACLAQAGHDPMIWSPSGESLSSKAIQEEQTTITASGALNFKFDTRIAPNCQVLMEKNDVLLIAIPAYGHKQIFDELAPLVRNDQHIIISSHSSLGALYLARLLKQRREITSVPITAWGTTVCTARRNNNNNDDDDDDGTNGDSLSVLVNTVRTKVDCCTIPFQAQVGATKLCQDLFGEGIEFSPRDGVLAISLSNLNPQNHLGIALGNMARIEKGEQWYQFDNITPTIGRFLEQLDKERLAIAEELKLEVKTIFEHFSQGFQVPIKGSISDMNQAIHAAGRDVFGPTSASSRYVTEDAPFGLAVIVVLGNLCGRPAILHQSGLQILSSMYGRDFMNENDLLDALNLDNISLDDLKKAAYTGDLTEGKSQTDKQQVSSAV